MKSFDRPLPHEEGKRRFEQMRATMEQATKTDTEGVISHSEEPVEPSDVLDLLEKLPPVNPEDPMHRRKDLDY